MAFDSYNNTLQFDCPNTDTIYFSGLPTDITEDEVAKFFGQLGTIKMDKKKRPPAPKVWLYKDKETGVLKGDGTIAFEDPFAAGSAVSWFNGTEFRGNKISVSLAQRKGQEPPSWGGGGGGRSRGYGGRGGGGGYGGDRRGYDDRRGGGYQDHRGGYGRDRGGYDGGRGGGYDGGRGGGYDGGRGGGGYDRGMGGYEGGYGPDPRYDQPPPSRYDQEPPQRVSDQVWFSLLGMPRPCPRRSLPNRMVAALLLAEHHDGLECPTCWPPSDCRAGALKGVVGAVLHLRRR
mmetsp:Transcript_6540/g.15713  ORF Transcript_6540/g.15713 Transcript_6540/m.15713 type:complete len:288 (-) Transcript_6540:571-1434(-)